MGGRSSGSGSARLLRMRGNREQERQRSAGFCSCERGATGSDFCLKTTIA
ncbi:hypothetical protein KFK09_001131 [Dendrobium nobile]|uniref:Uncharacterized protein n=1 Tax=Dendrobium nobile TaxID=94219 RepID=A0A8T3C8T2_DENNO|nr:hypothetical protein KFK09_001131 [Dendrobium nobile]